MKAKLFTFILLAAFWASSIILPSCGKKEETTTVTDTTKTTQQNTQQQTQQQTQQNTQQETKKDSVKTDDKKK